jgi:hypothetical protein
VLLADDGGSLSPNRAGYDRYATHLQLFPRNSRALSPAAEQGFFLGVFEPGEAVGAFCRLLGLSGCPAESPRPIPGAGPRPRSSFHTDRKNSALATSAAKVSDVRELMEAVHVREETARADLRPLGR